MIMMVCVVGVVRFTHHYAELVDTQLVGGAIRRVVEQLRLEQVVQDHVLDLANLDALAHTNRLQKMQIAYF